MCMLFILQTNYAIKKIIEGLKVFNPTRNKLIFIVISQLFLYFIHLRCIPAWFDLILICNMLT